MVMVSPVIQRASFWIVQAPTLNWTSVYIFYYFLFAEYKQKPRQLINLTLPEFAVLSNLNIIILYENKHMLVPNWKNNLLI